MSRVSRCSPAGVLVFQIHYLRLTTAILRHEKSRKYLLSNVLYPLAAKLKLKRSVMFEPLSRHSP